MAAAVAAAAAAVAVAAVRGAAAAGMSVHNEVRRAKPPREVGGLRPLG